MARILHDHGVEVFAFSSTGLKQALIEAASVLREHNHTPGSGYSKPTIDETKATLEYRDGTFYVLLPYLKGDDSPGPDDLDEEYDLTSTTDRRDWRYGR